LRPAATGHPPADAPRVALRRGQRAVWTEAAYGLGLVYAVLSLIALVAAGLAVWTGPWVLAPVGLVAVAVLTVSTARIVVDGRGLHIGFGPWGWPRLNLALREIEYAEVTQVRARDWGGWGYRARPGGRALVLRNGPGVRLELSDQRVFMATVRDPRTVAGLVNTMIEQTGRPATRAS
jgi:hypothetical protein